MSRINTVAYWRDQTEKMAIKSNVLEDKAEHWKQNALRCDKAAHKLERQLKKAEHKLELADIAIEEGAGFIKKWSERVIELEKIITQYKIKCGEF